MTYLLPQMNSNGLYEDHTDPLGLSLTDYLSKLTPSETHTNHTHSPYVYIMAELIRTHNLSMKDSLHIGTRSCLEYLENIKIKGVYLEEGTTGTYPCLVDDTGEFDLTRLSYQEIYGTYIARIPESTSSDALQYLYKLCCSYKHVYLCKPESDCAVTSTKYIVAMHYYRPPDVNNLRIPYYFRMKLEEINSVFGQTQIEHLRFMESKSKNGVWMLKPIKEKKI